MPNPCRRAALLVAPFLIAVSVGCEKESARVDAPQPVVIETPEQRFDRIIESLKRHVEDEALGDAGALLSYDAPPGTPVTDATTRVTHEITPPAAEGEPYRATISLLTQSTVTMVLPQKSEEEKQQEEQAEAGLGEEIEGIPSLESLKVPSLDSSAAMGGSAIQTLPGEQVSTFELEFRDGKWELLTELDFKNEPFFATAIEYAIKLQ